MVSKSGLNIQNEDSLQEMPKMRLFFPEQAVQIAKKEQNLRDLFSLLIP